MKMERFSVRWSYETVQSVEIEDGNVVPSEIVETNG